MKDVLFENRKLTVIEFYRVEIVMKRFKPIRMVAPLQHIDQQSSSETNHCLRRSQKSLFVRLTPERS